MVTMYFQVRVPAIHAVMVSAITLYICWSDMA